MAVLSPLDGAQTGGSADEAPFLADWVFTVVYGGFIPQGLALGGLFVLYIRDRWGHLLRGRARPRGWRARAARHRGAR